MSQNVNKNSRIGVYVVAVVVVVAAGALYALTQSPGDNDALAFGDIDVNQANELIMENQSNSDFVVLDVRTPDEVNAGVVEHENANFTVIDFYDPQFNDQITQLDKDTTYVIYCRTGNRSGQTLERMKEMGFDKLYNIQGGITAWQNAGLPTQQVLE